jgi:predicted house-cleaning noncanonical NTP pyrophosphatase (MazG superfamily)
MNWIKTNADAIGAICAIGGLLVVLIGFPLTIYQLISTERTLRASNTYEIQKDARDIIEKIISDIDFRKFLKEKEAGDLTEIFEDKIWEMLNFYLSVYRQDMAGGVTSEFVISLKNDFCVFTSRPSVSSAWPEMEKSGKIGPAHVQMKDAWCG